MASKEPMGLLEFQQHFSNEGVCYQHLYKMKWPDGFRCPACGHDRAYEITTRSLPLYECTECRHQTSVKVGTIFQQSRISLLLWFWAVFFVAHDKRGVSAVLLAKDLGVRYQTAWLMLHKIRKAMAERDAGYRLGGIVEMDEAYFGAPTEGGKRGRGTDKTLVLVSLSLTASGHPLFVKFQVIPDFKGATLTDYAVKTIEPGSTIISDGLASYKAMAGKGFTLDSKVSDHVKNPDHLNWLHTIVSNAKAFLAGTFHGVDEKHMQRFFDEFVYRFNRRTVPEQMFNRLLTCCAMTGPITFPELTA